MRTPPEDKSVEVRLNRAFVNGTLPKDMLICGPAGSGKTLPILTFLHRLACDHTNLRILIVRQTRASLTSSVLVSYEQEVLHADGMESLAHGIRRNNRQSYAYPSGSEIVLGGMDKPDRVLSTAWDLVYFNEAIEGEESAWDTLASRLGRPGRVSWLGNLIGDTNPGDPSHWLKARCDDGRTVLWVANHRANPSMWTGTEWTEAGAVYNSQLDRLRGTRRRRLKDGIWSAGEGQWFSEFDADKNVSDRAEFNPRLPVHLAVDSGVHCGAVWFQVRGEGDDARVNVFGDYYAFNKTAFDAAKDILALSRQLCGGRVDRGSQDPAARASTATGVLTSGEFERAGLKLDYWPVFSVVDGLGLVDSFVSVEPSGLTVHPRCLHLIQAFANYKRAKRSGQFIDRPEDPQHPHEELLDSLRGGLVDKFQSGRKPQPVYPRVPFRRVF